MTDHISRIRDLFAAASDRILVVSAYVGETAVANLLDASSAVADRALYARWDTDDIASGASDWRVWDVAKDRRVPFFACPRLHAKMYIADGRAVVGSANATAAGLGLAANANLELLIEVDAHHPMVIDTLNVVRETATLATPFGPDAATRQPNSPERDDDPTTRIWLPASDPVLFLNALTGRAAHDDLTRQDCDGLSLAATAESSRQTIREAVRDLTAFRIVRHEFETRMNPMGLSDLRALLATRVNADLACLNEDGLIRLAGWLGQFGANTLSTPSPSAPQIQLNPGMLLGSDDEFDA